MSGRFPVRGGRIGKSARPAHFYVDPATLRPYGGEAQEGTGSEALDGTGAQAQDGTGAQALNTMGVGEHPSASVAGPSSAPPSALYPRQYAEDVARIERELEAEELGLKKPTRKEKIKAAYTKAYEEGDYALAASHKDHLERINERESAKRKRKKGRKAAIAAERRALGDGSRNSGGFDPKSR